MVSKPMALVRRQLASAAPVAHPVPCPPFLASSKPSPSMPSGRERDSALGGGAIFASSSSFRLRQDCNRVDDSQMVPICASRAAEPLPADVSALPRSFFEEQCTAPAASHGIDLPPLFRPTAALDTRRHSCDQIFISLSPGEKLDTHSGPMPITSCSSFPGYGGALTAPMVPMEGTCPQRPTRAARGPCTTEPAPHACRTKSAPRTLTSSTRSLGPAVRSSRSLGRREMLVQPAVREGSAKPIAVGCEGSGEEEDADNFVFNLPGLKAAVHSGKCAANGLEKTESMKRQSAERLLRAAEECVVYSSAHLAQATGQWSEDAILGKGSFGMVFKGELCGVPVAVKKLNADGKQGLREYSTEVKVLGSIHHPNVVRLLGHCPENHSLVYEYVPRGSLHDWLKSEQKRASLGWKARLKIMAGVASALATLHQSSPPIVHRDLKPDNILLDNDLHAKLADVGIARMLEEDGQCTYTVSGTAGYIDPESMKTFEISPASDVYSFGLNLLQLITGHARIQPVHNILSSLPMWRNGQHYQLQAAVARLVEQADDLAGAWPPQVLAEIMLLALQCITRDCHARPVIAVDVVPVLQELVVMV